MLTTMTVSAKSIVFTLSDGTLVYYFIGSGRGPIMKCVDGKCVVSADAYEFSQIKNLYVSETDDPAVINAVQATKDYSWRDNTFVVKTDSKDVRVYSVSGARCKSDVSLSDGFATVDASSLTPGAYIINVGGCSFKIVKE